MSFQQNLIEWFRANQRKLPWRRHYRPYEVWVSEIMLQQTQMDTVLPYYNRWMRSFPTLSSLAEAESRSVLKLWEGLGYYSRARNLHESAKRIVQENGGIFPERFEDILSIKGVGRYTAGAIASIAFNQDRPIVDGNILRVLSRVYAISDPIDIEKNKEIFWKLQERLIPKGQAREFNQALMELGALVCTSQNPACAICPIRGACRAIKKRTPENYPVKSRKKIMVRIEASALVFERNGKYLLRLRPIGKIMGGLWEFPEWKLSKNKKLNALQVRRRTEGLAQREFTGKIGALHPAGTVKRNYTHHLESLHIFKSSSSGITPKPKAGWTARWVSKNNFVKYPFSSAHAKIAAKI